MIKEQKIRFLHKSTMPKGNGEIEAYEIKVTDESIEETITLQVKPGHLISNISMKRILLDRKIFYSASKDEHTKTIQECLKIRLAKSKQVVQAVRRAHWDWLKPAPSLNCNISI